MSTVQGRGSGARFRCPRRCRRQRLCSSLTDDDLLSEIRYGRRRLCLRGFGIQLQGELQIRCFVSGKCHRIDARVTRRAVLRLAATYRIGETVETEIGDAVRVEVLA